MTRRRSIMTVLVLGTVAAAVTVMLEVLAVDGLSVAEGIMLALFTLTTPWVALGFWNALLGLVILRTSADPLALLYPFMRQPSDDAPISARTAIVMPVYDEDPERVFRHLQAVLEDLEATGSAHLFEMFLLSDTRDRETAREEESRFRAWRSRSAKPERLHYRRRLNNEGNKTGNLWEFIESHGTRFDCMLVLDADSAMGGTSINRLVRTMQVNPRLGILQSLVVGLPARSGFARVFQFGMRQGMRPYTVGSAWWQGDCGPYWGHNALIRLQPFREHCRLPQLAGTGPLAGHILSHDQVEAVLMRRAGYQVAVLAQEQDSYEENPPSLPDFIKRDLRWCQGNLQYLRLLRLPGLLPMGRVQLVLAVMMYLAAPCWLAFLAVGFGIGIARQDDVTALASGFDPTLGVVLFAGMLGMTFAPKIFGVIDIMLDDRQRLAYGGARKVLAGAVTETFFSLFIGPVVAFAQTRFIAGLLRGRRIVWNAQNRSQQTLSLADAARGLWPATLTGAVGAVLLAYQAPHLLPWASPVLVALLFAAPFATLTSSAALGDLLARHGACVTPEERNPTTLVARLVDRNARHGEARVSVGEPMPEYPGND